MTYWLPTIVMWLSFGWLCYAAIAEFVRAVRERPMVVWDEDRQCWRAARQIRRERGCP